MNKTNRPSNQITRLVEAISRNPNGLTAEQVRHRCSIASPTAVVSHARRKGYYIYTLQTPGLKTRYTF